MFPRRLSQLQMQDRVFQKDGTGTEIKMIEVPLTRATAEGFTGGRSGDDGCQLAVVSIRSAIGSRQESFVACERHRTTTLAKASKTAALSWKEMRKSRRGKLTVQRHVAVGSLVDVAVKFSLLVIDEGRKKGLVFGKMGR